MFEIWTHDEDIRRATGRPPAPPDPARLRRMSRIAVPSLPFGMAMSGLEGGGRTVRVVLTGAGGGTWDQALDLGAGPGHAEATVVVDVVDYCRLAARRVTPAQLDAVIEGDHELAQQRPRRRGRVLRLRRRVRSRAWTIRPSWWSELSNDGDGRGGR